MEIKGKKRKKWIRKLIKSLIKRAQSGPKSVNFHNECHIPPGKNLMKMMSPHYLSLYFGKDEPEDSVTQRYTSNEPNLRKN